MKMRAERQRKKKDEEDLLSLLPPGMKGLGSSGTLVQKTVKAYFVGIGTRDVPDIFVIDKETVRLPGGVITGNRNDKKMIDGCIMNSSPSG
ncbi:MAG: hypothetical protein WCV73_02365 [Patescibacteria group bacterium]|jgi:hypothetical protein